MRRYFSLLIVLSAALVMVKNASANHAEHVVTTSHTVLNFDTIEDMLVFDDVIAFAGRNSLVTLFMSPDPQEREKELARKVDLLFEKVQLILDMRRAMNKVKVRVYPNHEQLTSACEKIFNRECSEVGWYVYELNTIFLSADRATEGMLAHELGHAIIDHYLNVRPPRATAEILARYVDVHLYEEVRQY